MTKRARPEGDGGDLAAAVLLPLLRLQRRKERRCLLEKNAVEPRAKGSAALPARRAERCFGAATARRAAGRGCRRALV